MPITGIQYRYADTQYGKLYMALGKVEVENRYWGMWAFLTGPGPAQDVQFKKNQSEKDCWDCLAQVGLEFMEALDKKGLLRPGAFSVR